MAEYRSIFAAAFAEKDQRSCKLLLSLRLLGNLILLFVFFFPFFSNKQRKLKPTELMICSSLVDRTSIQNAGQ